MITEGLAASSSCLTPTRWWAPGADLVDKCGEGGARVSQIAHR